MRLDNFFSGNSKIKQLFNISQTKEKDSAKSAPEDTLFDKTPNFMPFSESTPSYEKGLEKFIENYEKFLSKKPVITVVSQSPVVGSEPESPIEPDDANQTEPDTGATPSEPVTSPEKTPSEVLKDTLTQLGEEIDLSEQLFNLNKDNEKIFTQNELYANITKMLESDNPEVSAIGQAIADVYTALGLDVPGSKTNSKIEIGIVGLMVDAQVVMTAIFRAIQGKVIDPLFDNDTTNLTQISKGLQYGISIDDLLALDKNGDGSIADELKAMLSDEEFLDTCKFMLQREENKRANNQLVREMNSNNNSEISVNEISENFGKNAIADLFKNPDGTVDRALMIALGGEISKDGNYTINTVRLMNNLYIMDADKDGLVTKEELAKFKESDTYKTTSYNLMMSEMERSNDKSGNFDGKFTLTDIEKFIKNNPTATQEQREFWSVITNITDQKFKDFVIKAIGGGSSTISILDFTQKLDTNGDGIVSKEELQQFVKDCENIYY